MFTTRAVPENADNKLDGNLGQGCRCPEYVRRRRMTVAAAEVVTGIAVRSTRVFPPLV